MKKIFLSFVLVVSLVVSQHAKAAELYLYSQDGFDVKTSAYMQDEKRNVLLVKGSDLNITFTADKSFQESGEEPVVSLKVFKGGSTEEVFTLKTPAQKIKNPEGAAFEKYLADNKNYVENFKLVENKAQLTIPLNLPSGKYDTVLDITVGKKKSNMTYSFEVSKSAYNFTTSDIIVENQAVLATIGYTSLLDIDATNTVAVTLTQDGKEVFRKEFDKTFYSEGAITIDETISELKDLTGKAELKIEVKDKDGSVILSTVKSVDLLKTNSHMLYYIIVGILILLLVGLYFVVRTKRNKIIAYMVVLGMAGGAFAFVPTGAHAVAECGGVAKPVDSCLETYKITNACKIDETCYTSGGTTKRYFSTGKTVSVTGFPYQGKIYSYTGVCGITGLATGDKFYVLSDSSGSAWQRKQYHIFSFVKGTSSTVKFDSGSGNRNVNEATYDGNCGVTVTGSYVGSSSSASKATASKIVEMGEITPTACRSRSVNSDLFENNSNLLSLTQCSTTELLDTHIGGSTSVSSPTGSAWSLKTVNMCANLGASTSTIASLKASNKSFFALFDDTTAWRPIRYPVFQFSWGVAANNTYRYGYQKENSPYASYDGVCSLSFKVVNNGVETDQWYGTYNLIEAGKVENATCRDPMITDDSTYVLGHTGYNNSVPKYNSYAPFFLPLSLCTTATQCEYAYSWVPVSTDQACNATTTASSCSCNGRSELCTTGSATTTTPNAAACALSSSCSAVSGSTTATFTIIPSKAIGNITYTVGTTTATQNNTAPFVYTTPKKNGTQSISATLQDAFDSQTVTSSCYVNNASSTPANPSVSISKSPAVTLNKNGQCTISWNIQDMPDDASCVLSGFGVNKVVTGVDSQTFGPLTSNQKYVITCQGGTLTPPLTASTICRVNPDVKEN